MTQQEHAAHLTDERWEKLCLRLEEAHRMDEAEKRILERLAQLEQCHARVRHAAMRCATRALFRS